ncbi:FMN-binding protein [Streptomyces cyaneochromogenes]|uniref:FMN-binding protein n=1 Tax=Streptomyces cyaneochromogenes TaxID=2496836 RepID=A0A3Q9EU14_9ACTN|nr:FMN-binding protein [Streptomyces cyaneochromogenes]AZQ36220.1 FMN-binding protein [Streptomyces cyaneochromogenes]
MRKKHPFRHALLATVGTVSGIVLLLSLKPTTDPSAVQAEPAITPSATAPASPSASASPSPSKTPGKTGKKRTPSPSSTSTQPPRTASAAPTRTGSAPSAPKTTVAAPTTRTVTGATAETKYGPVQVRITLTGSRITEATAVRSPDGTARSRDINSTAVPKLNQETLQAQSADIDTVSGATYTSAGYRQSLQSALDRAGA